MSSSTVTNTEHAVFAVFAGAERKRAKLESAASYLFLLAMDVLPPQSVLDSLAVSEGQKARDTLRTIRVGAARSLIMTMRRSANSLESNQKDLHDCARLFLSFATPEQRAEMGATVNDMLLAAGAARHLASRLSGALRSLSKCGLGTDGTFNDSVADRAFYPLHAIWTKPGNHGGHKSLWEEVRDLVGMCREQNVDGPVPVASTKLPASESPRGAEAGAGGSIRDGAPATAPSGEERFPCCDRDFGHEHGAAKDEDHLVFVPNRSMVKSAQLSGADVFVTGCELHVKGSQFVDELGRRSNTSSDDGTEPGRNPSWLLDLFNARA